MLNQEQYSKIMNEIRQKLEKAEQLVINCHPKSVYAISDVDVLLEKYKKYKYGREWRTLSEDQEIMKKEFATSCVCKKKEKK